MNWTKQPTQKQISQLNSDVSSLSAQIATLTDYSEVNATKEGSTWSSGVIKARRRGYTVTLKLDAAVLAATSGRTLLATIPTGYRPVTELTLFADNGNKYLISTDGGLRTYGSQSAVTIYGAVTYLCNR